MKVLWSWQSDTPGKVGRHFVRNELLEAIKVLKQPEDIEEPTTAETREALHLDHDRQGVSGSPDLAPTIYRKIDASAVFIADVTLVGLALDGGRDVGKAPKKFINSNSVSVETNRRSSTSPRSSCDSNDGRVIPRMNHIQSPLKRPPHRNLPRLPATRPNLLIFQQ
ncbi:MAG: hypothetical protein JWM91_4487 [Rhodospirillales bacterium]|nr:hypothetical protein [Rhodospirillales bacterium]